MPANSLFHLRLIRVDPQYAEISSQIQPGTDRHDGNLSCTLSLLWWLRLLLIHCEDHFNMRNNIHQRQPYAVSSGTVRSGILEQSKESLSWGSLAPDSLSNPAYINGWGRVRGTPGQEGSFVTIYIIYETPVIFLSFQRLQNLLRGQHVQTNSK